MSSEKTGLESNPTGSEFFDALREMNSDWIARAAAEVELGLKLSKNLSSAHSVPDAITAYQEWLSEEMSARAEDARLLMSNGQKFHGHQLSTSDQHLDERQHEHLSLYGRITSESERREQRQVVRARTTIDSISHLQTSVDGNGFLRSYLGHRKDYAQVS